MAETAPSSDTGHLPGQQARSVAFTLLEDVLSRHQALDHTLERNAEISKLDTRDRAFVRMLVSTTLRKLGQVDDLIVKAMERPDALKSDKLRHVLRLGTTQIAFMNIPDHAAVDTAVNLTQAIGMNKQSGFVNAVLRNIAKTGQDWIRRQDPNRLNTPEWLLKIWIEDYGLRTAAQIAQANGSEAPLDLTLKSDESRIYWSNTLQATELKTGSLRKQPGGSVVDLPGYDEGAWWIQDAAAAIPARLFGEIAGQTVLDFCAAPGGKAAQLADQGARVIAIDRAPNRIKKLEQNLSRLKLLDRVDVRIADATQWRPEHKDGPLYYILLDAPCTATGTARRHPDVIHLKDARDLERLSRIQENILQNAFHILAPEGVLIYCTCSLQKEEGEYQIDRFLAQNPDAARIPIRKEELGGYEDPLTEHGDLRILPFHNATLGGMDGFFIARLTKTP